jgi:cytochrome c
MRAFLTLLLAAHLALPAGADAADDKAAEKVLKDNDCTKCHTVAREKEGPAYKKVAEKYKGKPDAMQKLIAHMTSEPMVEVDGKKEKHKMVKADDAAIKNLAEWILSR